MRGSATSSAATEAPASARSRRSASSSIATLGTSDAWCHASQGLRRFALDAIGDARLLDAKAKNVALRELEAALDAGYGIYGGSGAKVRWATLLFDADAAQWVANEEWHPEQKSRWRDDGRYELQVPFSDPTELAMDILRHGASIVVTGDKALVALIRARLADAAARYHYDAPAGAIPNKEPA